MWAGKPWTFCRMTAVFRATERLDGDFVLNITRDHRFHYYMWSWQLVADHI